MSEIKTRTRINDPIYHKQYYENKLKNQNFICDVCKCELNITNKSRHLKTKKHIKQFERYIPFVLDVGFEDANGGSAAVGNEVPNDAKLCFSSSLLTY